MRVFISVRRMLFGIACLSCFFGAAYAQTTLLNTGATQTGTLPVLTTAQSWADEFTVAANSTVNIDQLAVYLRSGASTTGNLTFNLYTGNIVNARSANLTAIDSAALPMALSLSTTAQWVTLNLSTPWTITNNTTTAADYWLGVTYSNGSGVDIPLVTNTGTGTTPALNYVYLSGGTYRAGSPAGDAVGMQIVAVPEPTSNSLLFVGLLPLAIAARIRKAR